MRYTDKQIRDLIKSHDNLLQCEQDWVKCIRRFDMGDYSPVMDELFDSENFIKEAVKLKKRLKLDEFAKSSMDKK